MRCSKKHIHLVEIAEHLYYGLYTNSGIGIIMTETDHFINISIIHNKQ